MKEETSVGEMEGERGRVMKRRDTGWRGGPELRDTLPALKKECRGTFWGYRGHWFCFVVAICGSSVENSFTLSKQSENISKKTGSSSTEGDMGWWHWWFQPLNSSALASENEPRLILETENKFTLQKERATEESWPNVRAVQLKLGEKGLRGTEEGGGDWIGGRKGGIV